MMNGLQTLSYWREYFDHPQGSKLGLFNASMSLGSMLGLFFVPYTGECSNLLAMDGRQDFTIHGESQGCAALP
jgi:hypothetical protein